MDWQRVVPPQQLLVGIAIANFDPPSDKYLRLLIGDFLTIEKQCGDWYCGSLLYESNKRGIFPKNYITVKENYTLPLLAPNDVPESTGCKYSSATDFNTIVSYDSPLIREISTVLRAWIKRCRRAYVERRIGEVLPVVPMMQDVTKWRRQVLSGKLTVDEIRKLKQKVARKIDVGNKKLRLDLVARDSQGNVVEPVNCSVLELYRHHVAANDRIEQDSRVTFPLHSLKSNTVSGGHARLPPTFSGQPSASSNVSVNRSLYLNILDFFCRAGNDIELSLALYDAKEQQFISEFFTMNWPQFAESADESTRRTNVGVGGHQQKVLFTDLSNKDLLRERLYLVCRVIRTGSFEKEHVSSAHHHESSSSTLSAKKTQVRQLYAVGAIELKEALPLTTPFILLNAAGDAEDQEKPCSFPFVQCFDDPIEQVLKRITETRSTSSNAGGSKHSDMGNGNTRAEGIWIGLQLMIGNLDEVKTNYAHVFTSMPAVIRKMGFPEVISNEDVRNDLYITLAGGDFSHCSRSDKNIEAKVCLVDENGVVSPEAILTVGPRIHGDAYYTSTVQYHVDKPRWNETLKMAIPIDDEDIRVNKYHIRFTFRHRSSNESRDKTEKPFALAFIRLMQSNETIMGNGTHELLVYKLDRKYEENDTSYHTLPATKAELEQCGKAGTSKNGPNVAGFSYSHKDSFCIKTLVCSTSLTQNVDLLGVLNWRSKRATLKYSLQSLRKSEVSQTGEEVVKFLRLILDSLFLILAELDDYDQLVFDCLVYVVGLINEHRYSNFKPVLDEYFKVHFCAPLAHEYRKRNGICRQKTHYEKCFRKLIPLFKEHIENVEERYERLLSDLKSMEYLIKCIILSRQLYLRNGRTDIDSDDRFTASMHDLFSSIANLMKKKTDHSIVCQGAALRYLPHCLADASKAFDERELAYIIVKVLKNFPDDRLQNEKLWCVQNLINSALYKRCEYRRILQPVLLKIVCCHIESDSELDTCVQILADLIVVLYGSKSECDRQDYDLSSIISIAFRPVIQVTVRLIQQDQSATTTPSYNSRLSNFVAVLLSILTELDATSHTVYVNAFPTRIDLIDFLTELLMLFSDLIVKHVFSSDWFQMVCKRNSVMLKILCFIRLTIKQKFLHDFEEQIWACFFHTMVTFITQTSLQLEAFSPEKRAEVLLRYKDMRELCAKELEASWFCMNFIEKQKFIPEMVGPFLQVTMLQQSFVRSATIRIFFDMVTIGLYSPRVAAGTESDSLFDRFERELYSRLDSLVEQGLGDFTYIQSLENVMQERKRTTERTELNAIFVTLTDTVEKLLTKLLEYREVRERFDCLDNRMSCTRKLLEFYRTINHTDLYHKYVQKLYELHMSCDNFIEAAFTLKLHGDTLEWSDNLMKPNLNFGPYGACVSERQLKEKLYYEILALFDKGQLWERAIETCLELQKEYQENTFDYEKLGGLMEKMSKLYRNIMTQGQQRLAPAYFRVGFYGRGFPSFLQNQVFVYRGQPCERLTDFRSRMKAQFPNANIMEKLTPPSKDICESKEMFLQINSVTPLANEEFFVKLFKNQKVDSRVSWYYKHNEVQKFYYQRRIPAPTSAPERKSGGDLEENEFSLMWLERTIIVVNNPFPGTMRCFPVTSVSSRELTPLEVAVETVQDSTRQLVTVIEEVEQTGGKELRPLQAKLQGILQPAVMGGISNYEKTFFTEEFASACTNEQIEHVARLKDMIASQIPLLEKAVYLHARNCPEEQVQFHNMLLDTLNKYKPQVEEKYGRKESLLPAGASLVPSCQPPQRVLTKYASIDGSQSPDISQLTMKRSMASRDWAHPAVPWNLRHGISAISGTVPRRTYHGGTTFKRKNSQPVESRDPHASVLQRLSNTSADSVHSLDNLGLDTNGPSSSTPHLESSNGIVNGVITLSEQITPRRPPRPTSGTSSGGGYKTDARLNSALDSSMSSLDQGCYDRVPVAMKYHAHSNSFDALTTVSESNGGDPTPPLPPRNADAAALLSLSGRRPSSGLMLRQNSIMNGLSSASSSRTISGVEEESSSIPDADNSGTVPSAFCRLESRPGRDYHTSFVIPRHPKPLPPKPTDNNSLM